MEVAVRQQSLWLLEEGENQKSQVPRIIVECAAFASKHSSAILRGMDKLGKYVCCAYQKRRNVTKVGRPTKNRTFRCR